ncbi:MAG: MBL fold metallo-hydrolase [Gemmatimonadaceae bacterium]
MLIKRFYHDGLAQASYLVGCQACGEALVIDANRDADQYIAAATSHGLRITHVTETHIHADYLSGSRELASHTGATLLLSAEGGPDWQYAFAQQSRATLLRDGDSFMVGKIRVDVMHTPGHTPEHLIFVATDTAATTHPVGAFTGDFIFVGDVGRPDLLERAAHIAGTMRVGAAQLYASLQRFVSRYPDYLQLWPGHGSGSACGKALGAVPQTSLGYEKLVNWALQIRDEASFIEAVLEGQPDPPFYFATMKRLNRDGPPILGAQPRITHRAAPELERILSHGGIVVDIRPHADYGAGYVPGTISLPLGKSFVGWAGWLLPYDRDVYLLSRDTDDVSARAAASELAMIGLDRVAGWFGSDAISSWIWKNGDLPSLPQTSPKELAEVLGRERVVLIDVRNQDEWDEGHVQGAEHVPLGRLLERFSTLPVHGASRVLVQCQGGGRSAIAASLLRAKGVAAENLRGGIAEWEREGYPVIRDSVAAAR